MVEYCKGRIYPNSVPEFRNVEKSDGSIEIQVRYLNSAMGYIGKWMPIQTEMESKE